MRAAWRGISAIVLFVVSVAALADQPPKARSTPVGAWIETTLKSASGQIGQFAFDGDVNSYFASAESPKRGDHFTLVFDKPVAVTSIVSPPAQRVLSAAPDR